MMSCDERGRGGEGLGRRPRKAGDPGKVSRGNGSTEGQASGGGEIPMQIYYEFIKFDWGGGVRIGKASSQTQVRGICRGPRKAGDPGKSSRGSVGSCQPEGPSTLTTSLEAPDGYPKIRWLAWPPSGKGVGGGVMRRVEVPRPPNPAGVYRADYRAVSEN